MCNVSNTLWLWMRRSCYGCQVPSQLQQKAWDTKSLKVFQVVLTCVQLVPQTHTGLLTCMKGCIFNFSWFDRKCLRVLKSCFCALTKGRPLCEYGHKNAWNACPFHAMLKGPFSQGVKLNYIILKCVNAWWYLGGTQLEREMWQQVGGGLCSCCGWWASADDLHNAFSSCCCLSFLIIFGHAADLDEDSPLLLPPFMHIHAVGCCSLCCWHSASLVC